MYKLICLIFLYPFTIFSQGNNSSTPEKIVFSDVVRVDSINSIILSKNAEKWLDKHHLANTNFESPLKMEAVSSFFVYQKGLVSNQIHGKITYKILLEIKDNKYRYTFSDFVFHYYKQDKNYKMVPTGKSKFLEDTKASGWQKTWNKHKAFTVSQIELLINDLKATMAISPNPVSNKISPKVKEEF